MRKKKLVKRLLSGLLAVSMAFGMAGVGTAYAEGEKTGEEYGLAYFVDCGDYNPETVPEGEELGRNQSVTDRIDKQEPDTTGKRWGVVANVDQNPADPEVSVETGNDLDNNKHEGSKAVFTQYQWANQRLTADESSKDASFRYARGQDTANPVISPRYIKYRFDVEAGRYQIDVGMGNTWNNAGNPDVYAGTTGEKDTDTKLNDTPLAIPANGHKEAGKKLEVLEAGSLYVYALSNDGTIQMNYIRITKIPENLITGVEVENPVTAGVFGEELDTSAMTVQAVYEDGSKKKVDNYEVVGYDSGRTGKQTIRVKYTECCSVESEAFDIVVKYPPVQTSEKAELAYFVDCGDFDPATAPKEHPVGANQSVTDRIYGEDKNGKSWGVVTSETQTPQDVAIAIPREAQSGSNAVYTSYQWANERQDADAPKEGSFRYAKDQGVMVSRYVKYKFDVDAGEYQITVEMGNTWGNAANPDVYAGSTGEKDTDVKLNEDALNIPENGHKTAEGTVELAETGSLYVYALSSEATIQMNDIQIIKMPENAITELKITQNPSKTEYILGEELDVSGMKLQAVYRKGNVRDVDVKDCVISGFDGSKLGVQTITVENTENSLPVKTSFEVIVKKPPLAVSTDPNLVYFVDCGDYDPETNSKDDAVGPNQSVTDRIYGEDKNGKSWGVVTSETQTPQDAAIAIPNEAQPGSCAVYTTYQWAHERQTEDTPKEQSFRYARDQGKAGISPRYVKYCFDVDDGEYQITAGMGNSWNNAGNPDVYAGITGEKDTDIKLNAEALNIPNNGHKEAAGTVKLETDGSLYVYALSNDETIQMNYIQIKKVPQNAIKSLKITQQPVKKEYEIGEELDTTGLSLEAVYKDGTAKAVAVEDCKITGFDSSKAGTKSVTVSYQEVLTVEAVFTVTVRKPAISVSQDPNLMYFVDCGDFDPETTSEGDAVSSSQSVTDQIYGEDKNGKKWGVVTSDDGDEAIPIPETAQKGSNAVYTAYQWAHERQEDDTPKEGSFRYAHDQGAAGISPRYVKYRFELEPGRYLVTVGVGNSWGNSGNPDVYAGMTGNPGKDAKLNAQALAIPAGETREVTGRTVVAEGKNTLDVYALSEEETIQVNYIRIEKAEGAEEGTVLKRLRIVPPKKVIYQRNEEGELDTEGMSVYAVYSDGYERRLPIGECEITGFDAGVLGTQTITVKYTEGDAAVQALFEVIIVNEKVPIVPESLQITPPVKTEYQTGEQLDVTGMEITVIYKDGTEKQVKPEDCKITGFDSSREGRCMVTASYEENGKTVEASFAVTIRNAVSNPETYKVIYYDNKGGKISGMPSDKKSYQKGEEAKVGKAPISTSKFFAGWNTEANGKGKSYAPGKKITVNGNVRLYAQWKKSYTAKNKLKYKVTGKKTVSCIGTANKKATSIKVPMTVTYNGITYKVTSVGSKAFAKNKKLKKVSIGNNVKVIKARAFMNCKSLKSITIGTGLAAIDKYAFSGEKKGCVLTIKSKKLKTVKTAINHRTKNMAVKVPKSKLKSYRKLFAKKAKNVKVIAK